MVEITKGVFITDVLATIQDIYMFNTWLNSDTPTSKAVKMAWDSSNNVILDSPFVQSLITLLVPTVLSVEAKARFDYVIANYNSQPIAPIVYTVIVKALDVITAGNPWGVVNRGDNWEVRVDFRNETSGQIYNEVIWFNQVEQPTEQQLNDAVSSKLAMVKAREI